MSQPGMSDGTKLDGTIPIKHIPLRQSTHIIQLLDEDIEVVNRLLALAEIQMSRRPSEPRPEIIRISLEGNIRRLQRRCGTLLRAGRRKCRPLGGCRSGGSGRRLAPDS